MLAGAVLLGGLGFSASAGVPKVSVPIVLAGDGNIYSDFPDGNVEPPPPYEALHITLGTALADCGFGALIHGTPDSCEIRSLVTGTNALTATITIENETGDDATDAGFSIETAGAGDDVLFSSTGNTTKSGTFAIKVSDGTSSETSLNKSWAMSASAGSDDPIVADRDISFEMDFASGQINDIDYTEVLYGRTIAKDAINAIVLEPDCTFVINDITDNDATADFTWNSGCGPSTREGFQLGDATGMNEVDGRMFRGLSLTGGGTSSGSGQLWQDGDDDGCCIPSSWGTLGTPELPSDRTSTVGYGTFSGTVTATTFEKENYQAGCCDSSSDGPVKVVEDGFVPPSNLNGAADPVDALRDSFFLSTQINYWQPYDVWNNSSGVQNHRWSLSTNPDALNTAWCAYNEECWWSFAIYLPSNYDSNDADSSTQTEFTNTANEVFLVGEVDDGDDGLFAFWLAGGPGNVDAWSIGVHVGSTTTALNRASGGSVTADLGHWTCFIANVKPHTSTGFAKVWKHSRCEDNNPADIALLVNITGGVGFSSAVGWATNPRNYKFGWNSNTTATPSTVIWMGYDEIRFGSATNEGATFSDVHPHGASQP